ncbi:MAG: VWA domain-containing protein, partial [Gammaproteobacteria bacterium]
MGKWLHKWLFSTAIAVLVGFSNPTVWADDIEIYVGTNAKTVRPNILFIMDTSGSMRSTVPGTGKSRLKIMQEALNEILDSVSNVNVGLMRFTAGANVNAGGPILYPVRYVDAAATTPKVESQINASSDDAVEDLATGAVNTTQPAIDMVEGSATSIQTATLPVATGNYQENGRVSTVGGSCCSYMGFGN